MTQYEVWKSFSLNLSLIIAWPGQWLPLFLGLTDVTLADEDTDSKLVDVIAFPSGYVEQNVDDKLVTVDTLEYNT